MGDEQMAGDRLDLGGKMSAIFGLIKLLWKPLLGAALIAGMWFAWVHHGSVRYRAGIAAQQAADTKAFAALEAAANARIANLTAQYNAASQQLQEKADAQVQADAAQHSADLKRLREYDAYRKAHPDVQGAPGLGQAAPAGNGSAQQDEGFTQRLELVSSELADSVRDGIAALTLCMAERDLNTGK